MTDIGTFPTIANVLESGANVFGMTATTAVKAGQVVAIAANGVSGAVDKAVAVAGSRSIGVALTDAAAGEEVGVCGPGCVVTVANADDGTTIDAGSFVETNDNTVGGTISAVTVAMTAGATATSHNDVIGLALDDIAGTGTGRILIIPQTYTQVNSS